MSKEFLLRQADTLLAQARQARKSSASQPEADRHRLIRHAEEMEGKAARLEKEAESAKTGVTGALTGDWLSKLANRTGRTR
jgi:hypothetical protein